MLTWLALAALVGAGADPPSEPGPDSGAKTRLAIMSVSATGVPEAYAVGLTETIATVIAQTGVFDTVSPRQIQSVLAFEKRKDTLGGCVEDACYVQVAELVQAQHLVGGSVAKLGEQLVLNLVLIDAKAGTALQRTSRETTSSPELLRMTKEAAIVLLQPLLGRRRGYLNVAANVSGAQLVVDDQQRAEGVGQVIALPAGPHTLKVSKDGFYAATADVLIQPGRVEVEQVSLIPARDTIAAYEAKAHLMRYGGYATGALAIGGAVLSAIFYDKASGNKQVVDSFTNALDIQRAMPGVREQALSARDSFQTNQGLYLACLGGAVVAGSVSVLLFLAGDDPDRYEEFRAMSGR
jgi:TolB-like protein